MGRQPVAIRTTARPANPEERNMKRDPLGPILFILSMVVIGFAVFVAVLSAVINQ